MTALSLIAPDPRAPGASISGGNVYNLGLLAALRAAGVDARVLGRDAARPGGVCLVDSLYLDVLPRFAPCVLLAHYLPSLVDGTAPTEPERAALEAAAGFVVPSPFMAAALAPWSSRRPTWVVAPAVERAPSGVARRAGRAVMVANVVQGKGVLELVRALRGRTFSLAVVGSLDAEPSYAAACRAGAGVELLGPLPHDETLALVAGSDFVVSASRMESFGLALAEARAMGVPIVARRGGNVEAHVHADAGGELVDDDDALADACVRLAADPVELERRRRAARAHVPPARSWADAARELLQGLSPARLMPSGA